MRRLALFGASPLLPGTQPPAPIRVAVAPVIGDLLAQIPPSERMVVRFMGAMGEGQTIVQHPDLLASLVAAGNDPVAAKANLDEFRAITTPFGFKRRMRIKPEELRRLTVPTLVVWGDRDPVGWVEVARAVNELIPDSRLQVLPAGEVPWLGNVGRVAALLSAFIAASSA